MHSYEPKSAALGDYFVNTNRWGYNGYEWLKILIKKIKEEKKYGTKTINPVHVSNFVEMKRKCRTKLVNRVQLCM